MLASRFFGDNHWDDDEDEDEDDEPSAEQSHDPPTSKRRRRASTSAGRALSQGGGYACRGYYDASSVGLDWAKMTSTHPAVAKLVTTNAFEGASNRMTSPSPHTFSYPLGSLIG
jgi:hypothetical protein